MAIVSSVKGLLNNAGPPNVKARWNIPLSRMRLTSMRRGLPHTLVGRMSQGKIDHPYTQGGGIMAIVRWDPFRELQDMSGPVESDGVTAGERREHRAGERKS